VGGTTAWFLALERSDGGGSGKLWPTWWRSWRWTLVLAASAAHPGVPEPLSWCSFRPRFRRAPPYPARAADYVPAGGQSAVSSQRFALVTDAGFVRNGDGPACGGAQPKI